MEEDFSAPHVRAKFIMILGPIRFKFEGRLCYFDRTMPTHLMHTHTAEAIQVSLFSQVLYLPCPRRQDVLTQNDANIGLDTVENELTEVSEH